MTVVYVVDGSRIGCLEDFWVVMGEAVNGPGGYFGKNLDALHDCLTLARCHPSNRSRIRRRLAAARKGKGETVFDWLTGIFAGQIPGRLHLR